ncbi:MAG: FAD-dependent tricarballylate dehydrogenase TcuA [Pseudomonadota bacterium]|nr:FAD-dependent tricarballylate dehydrogenase TcuA [Pseudomonadota bacterium]
MTRVVIVGGGNAALCAAISARERGVNVVLLERASYELRGGNSRFTAGAMRTVYQGTDDLQKIMPDLTQSEIDRTEFGSYAREDFYEDLGRVTNYRIDPDLAERLVEESYATLRWMQHHGIRFLPLYGRQSFEIDGMVRFWGGLTVEAWGGGPGLVDSLTAIAEKMGVVIRYQSRATRLLNNSGNVCGVEVDGTSIAADAVVLACGGFESNPEWRTRYLGPGWDLAPVRGTRFNTGDGIKMATEIGAATRGHWSGCHAVSWDRNAPEFGDLEVGDNFQKHSYPLGIMVNANGERFVDEGADFRNYTYARYGHEVLKQPGQFAYQIFDKKVTHLLRDEYRIKQVTRIQAQTLNTLAERMDDVDTEKFVACVSEYNAACNGDTRFDPSIKDGLCTEGLAIPKSNWANPIDTPPFEAYGVTCGITFTFGGLHVDAKAQVIDEAGSPIPGLYAAGEIVGGLFYFNYPGGTGLTSGSVFGRIAGTNAADHSSS